MEVFGYIHKGSTRGVCFELVKVWQQIAALGQCLEEVISLVDCDWLLWRLLWRGRCCVVNARRNVRVSPLKF